jgi:hypothetical protein
LSDVAAAASNGDAEASEGCGGQFLSELRFGRAPVLLCTSRSDMETWGRFYKIRAAVIYK